MHVTCVKLLQVQALPTALGQSNLQTAATLKPGRHMGFNTEQMPVSVQHQAQAKAGQTCITPAVHPASTVPTALLNSLNCLQQASTHSSLPADGTDSLQPELVGHETAMMSWTAYSHYLQAAVMPAHASPNQFGPPPTGMNQTHVGQHAAVSAALARCATYQQQQLQATAALYNAAHLCPKMLHNPHSVHHADLTNSQLPFIVEEQVWSDTFRSASSSSSCCSAGIAAGSVFTCRARSGRACLSHACAATGGGPTHDVFMSATRASGSVPNCPNDV